MTSIWAWAIEPMTAWRTLRLDQAVPPLPGAQRHGVHPGEMRHRADREKVAGFGNCTGFWARHARQNIQIQLLYIKRIITQYSLVFGNFACTRFVLFLYNAVEATRGRCLSARGPAEVSGSGVSGFLCESLGVANATDISALGGWRQYVHTKS